jgi:hypothetical protein
VASNNQLVVTSTTTYGQFKPSAAISTVANKSYQLYQTGNFATFDEYEEFINNIYVITRFENQEINNLEKFVCSCQYIIMQKTLHDPPPVGGLGGKAPHFHIYYNYN